jgi:hypothetical protein
MPLPLYLFGPVPSPLPRLRCHVSIVTVERIYSNMSGERIIAYNNFSCIRHNKSRLYTWVCDNGTTMVRIIATCVIIIVRGITQ